MSRKQGFFRASRFRFSPLLLPLKKDSCFPTRNPVEIRTREKGTKGTNSPEGSLLGSFEVSRKNLSVPPTLFPSFSRLLSRLFLAVISVPFFSLRSCSSSFPAAYKRAKRARTRLSSCCERTPRKLLEQFELCFNARPACRLLFRFRGVARLQFPPSSKT